jgi:hypothetical protein
MVTDDRTPPRGFELEFDLGQINRFGQLGTSLLLAREDDDGSDRDYLRSTVDGAPAPGYRSLGYIEDAPFPMLNALELRRDRKTDTAILVSGIDDPLYEETDAGRVLGFIESYPIEPRHPPDARVDMVAGLLLRHADEGDWRHRYFLSDAGSLDSVTLGSLWSRSGADFVALQRGADGWLTTELCGDSAAATQRVTAKLRWSAAPLSWPEGGPAAWAARASASRMRSLIRHARLSRELTAPAQLGYLLRHSADGWSPIFSAVHPAIRDQYVTRSELEAGDMGYRIEGVLGYILDEQADRGQHAFAAEVKWASRFGQRRRFIEGPMRN